MIFEHTRRAERKKNHHWRNGPSIKRREYLRLEQGIGTSWGTSFRLTLAVFFSLVCLAGNCPAADSTRIAILPFLGEGLDEDIARQAHSRATEIIADEGPFALVPPTEVDRWLNGRRDHFLKNDEVRRLMRALGVSLLVEGFIEKIEADRTDIRIRINARSSSWRPPTFLSATDVALEHTVSRTESLIRQFLNGYAGEQSMERFFQSALIPGFGQHQEGQETKAKVFFLGTVGCIAGSFLLPDGDSYRGSGKVEQRAFLGDPLRWYIGDQAVSPEQALAELDKRAKAEDSRHNARVAKGAFRVAGLAMYVANLYDILKTARRYDPAKGSRFNFHFSPMHPERFVSLDCRLDL